ncbi:putative adhesin [Streptomyces sp. IBSNAI002]|uniref:putative adhesin n=1 Tax=Streptomyces sp. IBSNAI002 TaxID=3457500 RepID=UPI003FD0E4AA
MELWVIGHGEQPRGEQTFVPAGTTLGYFVKAGFVNNMPNGLAELSAHGAVHGLGQFAEAQEYAAGSPVPNHRLGAFSGTEVNNVLHVIWGTDQEHLFVGQPGLYDLIKLCEAPNSCRPPLHTCTGVLGDARIVGRKVHMIACRGVVSDLLRNTPPIMRDEYGPGHGQYTHYTYDKAGELHQLALRPGGLHQAADELQQLTPAVQAMTLNSSKQLQKQIQELDEAMTRIRGGGGWLDPGHLETLPGPWQVIHRKYHHKATVRMPYALTAFPSITTADCPGSVAQCVDGAWYPVFVSWYWHDRGTAISKPLLRFDELPQVRAVRHLLVGDFECDPGNEGALSGAFWALSGFFELVRKTNADRFLPAVAQLLTQGEDCLASFTAWDAELREAQTGRPDAVASGDPRAKSLKEAATAVFLVAREVLAWRDDAHRRFRAALLALTERDIVMI